MRVDVVLAGVGGQGVLSAAAILAEAARRDGLTVKQGEVHGMSQRGGAVMATVRMADGPIASDLVPRGSADLVVGMEPVEALRCLPYLGPAGRLITSADLHPNVPDYPDAAEVLRRVGAVPGSIAVNAASLARSAGAARAANVVMVGLASRYLPLAPATIQACIADLFATKRKRVVAANLDAFAAGREALPAMAG